MPRAFHKQKKWDVGPPGWSHVPNAAVFRTLGRMMHCTEERAARRVPVATAQSAAADFLAESDVDSRANAAFSARNVHGRVDEVRPVSS